MDPACRIGLATGANWLPHPPRPVSENTWDGTFLSTSKARKQFPAKKIVALCSHRGSLLMKWGTNLAIVLLARQGIAGPLHVLWWQLHRTERCWLGAHCRWSGAGRQNETGAVERAMSRRRDDTRGTVRRATACPGRRCCSRQQGVVRLSCALLPQRAQARRCTEG